MQCVTLVTKKLEIPAEAQLTIFIVPHVHHYQRSLIQTNLITPNYSNFTMIHHLELLVSVADTVPGVDLVIEVKTAALFASLILRLLLHHLLLHQSL